MKQHHFIQTDSMYVNDERKIAVLDYSQKYLSNAFDVLNSDEMAKIVALYLKSKKHADEPKSFEQTDVKTYLNVVKQILVDTPDALGEFDQTEVLQSIEDLYSFYRSFLRISVINLKNNNIVASEFMSIDNRFNELIRGIYRNVEEKLQGFTNKTYRQVNAGTNACVLVEPHRWQMPANYSALKKINFVDTIMLRPPMMMHTKSNKREGVFSAVNYNPIDHFNGDKNDWFCFPAKIGESLAFIYFHKDYFVSGLALANLFEVASSEEVENAKPDLVLLFGLEQTEGQVSHYYHDEENDIWVGEVPYNDKTTYFGYMKKMCLTLHNLHMIYSDRLPIHGSMVRIKFSNGKNKTVVFFGDSGAGKSESIEALQEIADEKIVELETIFDDMGSFALDDNGQVYAQGTETGAFVRLDDLSTAVAFNNMDRGVYLNPERKNARVIIPANNFKRVVTHHTIDMWVYANNYDSEIGVHQFENPQIAQETFIAGKRKALGTTDEVGMSTTFFANPFGPVQEEAKTRPLINTMFEQLYKQNIYVGEIYTHLGNDKSKGALNESAKQLLDVLMHL
ncbi:phosphoenolpyruvate carboxykinase [Paucilactobacillus sp. N302-9]